MMRKRAGIINIIITMKYIILQVILGMVMVFAYAAHAKGTSITPQIEQPERIYSERDIENLRERAKAGDSEAQVELAVCYGQGNGLARDYEKAYEWLMKAVAQGNLEAQRIVGETCYLEGKGTEQNATEGIKWIRHAAEQGHAKAQMTMGQFYIADEESRQELGIMDAIPYDAAEGERYLRMAAENKYIPALILLGTSYTVGEALPVNIEESEEMFARAEKLGADKNEIMNAKYIAALVALGNISPNTDAWKKVLGNMTEIASREDGWGNVASGTLGMMYYWEIFGAKEDKAEAARWLKNGKGYALYRLAMMYWNGDGVEKDRRKALHIMKTALDSASEEAVILHAWQNMSRSLNANEENEGNINTDKSELFMANDAYADENCFKIAENNITLDGYSADEINELTEQAKGGSVEAQTKLGVYRYLRSGLKDEESYAMVLKAAEQGHAEAEFFIGCFFSIKKDGDLSVKWLRRAVEHGYMQAAALLAAMLIENTEDTCNALGAMQRGGEGENLYLTDGKRNVQEGLNWLHIAAAHNDATALAVLGRFYLTGEYVPRDEHKAYKMFAAAAELGQAYAKWRVGQYTLHEEPWYTEKGKAAVRYIEEAAEAGNTKACESIGFMYYWGTYGKDEDKGKAAKWLERGSAEALYMLIGMYWNGDGVEKDRNKALQLSRKLFEKHIKSGFGDEFYMMNRVNYAKKEWES